MPLDSRRAQIWDALGLGPQWVERGIAPEKAQETEASAPLVPAPAVPPPVPRAQVPAPAARTAEQKPEPVAADPGQEAFFEKVGKAGWDELAALLPECRACPLAATRQHTVFADGAPGCPVVMVGEAPGAEEDAQGKPFVGKSGQLLTAALAAVGFERGKEVAIVNVLKCRPPRNRDPQASEVTLCRHFLDRQLELLAPRVIVLMGRPAASAVLATDLSIGRLRTRGHSVTVAGREVPAVVTYHPSYLLRTPAEKPKFWHDLLKAKRLLATTRA